MGTYEPPRVRKGCKITLRNTDTGDIIKYNLIGSLFDSSKWWESPKKCVDRLDNCLSIKSRLGSELLGKRIGDVVGRFEIKNIESEDGYIINVGDSEERSIGDKQANMELLLGKLQKGDWLKARFVELSPLYETNKVTKTLIMPHYASLNGKKYLDSIWLTNKGQKKKKGFFKADIYIYSEDADATAEMILDEEAIRSLSLRGAVPSGILCNELGYVYSLNTLDLCAENLHGIEIMVAKNGQFICRVTPESRLDSYHMIPLVPQNDTISET